ncbi:MAG: hypothetical protein Kow0037_32310 [Calditrichia bacterium]
MFVKRIATQKSSGVKLAFMVSLLIAFLFIFISCEKQSDAVTANPELGQVKTCEGCHTDQPLLAQMAPGIDEPPPSNGGG